MTNELEWAWINPCITCNHALIIDGVYECRPCDRFEEYCHNRTAKMELLEYLIAQSTRYPIKVKLWNGHEEAIECVVRSQFQVMLKQLVEDK